MSLDLLVQAALAPEGGTPPTDAKEARFKLQSSLVFLEGKKLGPLRTLEQATFEHDTALLRWPHGPVVLIRFLEKDLKGLETLKEATEAAQKRGAKPLGAGTTQPVRAVLSAANACTPVREDRRRPVLDSRGSAEKRRAQFTTKEVDAMRNEDAPVDPIVDSALSEDERQKRRKLAAVCAEDRVLQIQARGIGDVSFALRMKERAEREELVGRITERYVSQRKELPWNIGGAPVAELRAHLKSLSRPHAE